MTHHSQLRPFLIIFQEESKILICYVNIWITTQTSMFFLSLLTPGKAVLVNFVFDLIGRVTHIDTRGQIRCAHLGLRSLQRREKLWMQQSGLGIFEFRGNITGKTEIWILINCTRDEWWNIGYGAEDLREGVWEGWGRLNGSEVNFTDIVSRESNDYEWRADSVYFTYESLKPNVAFAWLMVICLEILDTLR